MGVLTVPGRVVEGLAVVGMAVCLAVWLPTSGVEAVPATPAGLLLVKVVGSELRVVLLLDSVVDLVLELGLGLVRESVAFEIVAALVVTAVTVLAVERAYHSAAVESCPWVVLATILLLALL